MLNCFARPCPPRPNSIPMESQSSPRHLGVDKASYLSRIPMAFPPMLNPVWPKPLGYRLPTFVDVASPLVFVRSEDVGRAGTELPAEIDADHDLLARLEASADPPPIVWAWWNGARSRQVVARHSQTHDRLQSRELPHNWRRLGERG